MKRYFLLAGILALIANAETNTNPLTQTGSIELELPTDTYYTAMKANDAKQINCIALTAYGEAADQGYEGMLAVAFVIMNRSYPKQPCEIVAKKFAFSIYNLSSWRKLLSTAMSGIDTKPTKMSELEQVAWENAVGAAINAYTKTEPDPTRGSLYYYSPEKVKELGYTLKSWHLEGNKITIKDHIFLTNI